VQETGLQLKSILNSIEKHKGFIYDGIGWDPRAVAKTLLVSVRPHRKSQGYCSGCAKKGPGYDTLPERRFQFVPLWGILVFLVYALRRIDCESCGVTVEMVPWADGKKRITKTFGWFLATWAKRLTWKDTADAFQTSWDTVFRAVEVAVEWGRERVDLTGITAIGVDEIMWRRGHECLTLVYQIDPLCKRLLWIGQHRTEETIKAFFTWFTPDRARQLKYICSDMWKPYLKVIAKRASSAIHVLDRFHIMSHFSKAIDVVRADEARKLKHTGKEPVLTGSRWCWLKRPENLTDTQEATLADLVRMNLKTVKCYLLKEDFQNFWEYSYPGAAGRFLDQWCTRTMRSRIEPMKKVARMLRKHRELLLNWFRAKGEISAGIVEGMNNKVKVTTRKAYGFRSYRAISLALYHNLGSLPEPEFTHRFCG
jgi:transposase